VAAKKKTQRVRQVAAAAERVVAVEAEPVEPVDPFSGQRKMCDSFIEGIHKLSLGNVCAGCGTMSTAVNGRLRKSPVDSLYCIDAEQALEDRPWGCNACLKAEKVNGVSMFSPGNGFNFGPIPPELQVGT
jgi:hypothetical protein